jgi:hypothetical protein
MAEGTLLKGILNQPIFPQDSTSVTHAIFSQNVYGICCHYNFKSVHPLADRHLLMGKAAHTEAAPSNPTSIEQMQGKDIGKVEMSAKMTDDLRVY